MPTIGETMLLQRKPVALIADFLGFESPAERRFIMVNRATYYIMMINKARRAIERSFLYHNLKEQKKQD